MTCLVPAVEILQNVIATTQGLKHADLSKLPLAISRPEIWLSVHLHSVRLRNNRWARQSVELTARTSHAIHRRKLASADGPDILESSLPRAIAKVETLLRFHIQQMIENYEEVYVSDREWKHLEEPYLSNYQAQRRNYRKKFASIIEEGIQKNEIKKIDAPTAVLIILHAVSGIESWHRSKAKINAQELEDNMVMIMIDGLRKHG